MTRTEQKEKRIKEILVAGLDLFIRKGLASTKIQDIADAVGMSVGLLFNYFESKEKLYEELIKTGIGYSQLRLTNIEGDGLAFFEAAAREIFGYLKTEPIVTKMFVLINQAKYNDASPEPVKELIDGLDYIEISVKKIKQGQKRGTIKKGNPTALAIAFWGAVSGIAEEVALRSDGIIPESDWVVDILRNNG